MKPSDVRRDRVAVLASTIVRELASVRIKDIEKTPLSTPEPDIVLTPHLKRLIERFKAARRAKHDAEKAIEAVGYRVSTSCDARGSVTLAWPYRSRDAEKETAKKRIAARCNAVRELRTSTLIDLVTLDEAKAKAIVSAFRIAVERI